MNNSDAMASTTNPATSTRQYAYVHYTNRLGERKTTLIYSATHGLLTRRLRGIVFSPRNTHIAMDDKFIENSLILVLEELQAESYVPNASHRKRGRNYNIRPAICLNETLYRKLFGDIFPESYEPRT